MCDCGPGSAPPNGASQGGSRPSKSPVGGRPPGGPGGPPQSPGQAPPAFSQDGQRPQPLPERLPQGQTQQQTYVVPHSALGQLVGAEVNSVVAQNETMLGSAASLDAAGALAYGVPGTTVQTQAAGTTPHLAAYAPPMATNTTFAESGAPPMTMQTPAATAAPFPANYAAPVTTNTVFLAEQAPLGESLHVIVHGAYGLRVAPAAVGAAPGAFVAAGVGQQRFQTGAAGVSADLSSPIWERNNQFEFQLGSGDSLLELEVDVSPGFPDSVGRACFDLRALHSGQWSRHREPLHGGPGGIIEFDVCVMQEQIGVATALTTPERPMEPLAPEARRVLGGERVLTYGEMRAEFAQRVEPAAAAQDAAATVRRELPRSTSYGSFAASRMTPKFGSGAPPPTSFPSPVAPVALSGRAAIRQEHRTSSSRLYMPDPAADGAGNCGAKPYVILPDGTRWPPTA